MAGKHRQRQGPSPCYLPEMRGNRPKLAELLPQQPQLVRFSTVEGEDHRIAKSKGQWASMGNFLLEQALPLDGVRQQTKKAANHSFLGLLSRKGNFWILACLSYNLDCLGPPAPEPGFQKDLHLLPDINNVFHQILGAHCLCLG